MARKGKPISARVESELAFDLQLVALIRDISLSAAAAQALKDFVASCPVGDNALTSPEWSEWCDQKTTPKSTPIQGYVEDSVAQKIEHLAWRSNVSVSNVARYAYAQYVQQAAFDKKALDNAKNRLVQQLVAIEKLRQSTAHTAV